MLLSLPQPNPRADHCILPPHGPLFTMLAGPSFTFCPKTLGGGKQLLHFRGG